MRSLNWHTVSDGYRRQWHASPVYVPPSPRRPRLRPRRRNSRMSDATLFLCAFITAFVIARLLGSFNG